jgi:hypothetical protein
MSTLVKPAISSHVRSGRFVQHERPAANIPARMRSRRLAGGAQFFGPRARIAVMDPRPADPDSARDKLYGWVLGRLTVSRD